MPGGLVNQRERELHVTVLELVFHLLEAKEEMTRTLSSTCFPVPRLVPPGRSPDERAVVGGTYHSRVLVLETGFSVTSDLRGLGILRPWIRERS